MAGASFQTISAALCNDRMDRVIRNLLQNDVAAWDKIPVKKRKWTGDVMIITLRTDRNNSVDSVLGNVEPAPGAQGFLRLTVREKRYLGKLQIELDAIVSADDSQGSVAVEPADELEGLLNDFKRQMTRSAFLGGGGLQGITGLTVAGSPIGVIWQHSNAITTYGYRGRFDDIVAQGQAFNFARFIRMDTYAQVGGDTLITDLSSRTITLLANIDTSALPAGVPCAVMVVGAASQAFVQMKVSGDNSAGDPVVLNAAGKTVGAMIGNMTGFLSNLTQPIHFGNDRTTAGESTKRIRSNFQIVNNNNAQCGDTLSGGDFDQLFATVRTKSGNKPDAVWMSWTSQVAFSQSMLGTNDANVRVMAQDGPKKLDAGAPANGGNDTFNSYTSRNGVPINCSDLCPDGIAIVMRYDGWERCFKGAPEGFWVGATGPNSSPLIKTQGETQYEATRAMFPEQFCTNPLSQAVLVGIADPA